LEGGFDRGAVRRSGVVYRPSGPWTPAVRHLLTYLADQGFRGAPRPVPTSSEDGDVVTYLDGETVGAQRPWPAWVHTGEALGQVGRWLHDYHQAVADYRPPPRAVWRESHVPYGPGVVIAHNDAAPYNAVWKDGKLVGFIDWDMAGPRRREDDLAWTAFSWVPLHARHVVAAEGFTDFGRRRARLSVLLDSYGTVLTADEVIARVRVIIDDQIQMMRQRASAGDATYQRMLEQGRAHDLQIAGRELPEV
jgi:aminoglycoside phosphotransferase (APT) family kinase protein